MKKQKSLFTRLIGFLDFKRRQVCEALDVMRAPVLAEKLGLKPIKINIPGLDGLCNPTVVRNARGWTVLARRPNYKIDTQGRYLIPGGISELTSETYLLEYSSTIQLQNVVKLSDDEAKAELSFRSNGFEDPRIFWNGSKIMGLWNALKLGPQPDSLDEKPVVIDGTVYDVCRPIWSGSSNIMTLAEIVHGRMTGVLELSSPQGLLREKNWMPFVHEDEVHFLYYLDEMQVFKLVDQRMVRVHRASSKIRALRGWSGSSQVIDWNGKWLCVAHYAGRLLKHNFKKFGPYYSHRLVLFSKDWELISLSPRFFFETKGLEFCAGLALHDGRFLFSYGVDDNSSSLLEVPEDTVNSMLRPPSSL